MPIPDFEIQPIDGNISNVLLINKSENFDDYYYIIDYNNGTEDHVYPASDETEYLFIEEGVFKITLVAENGEETHSKTRYYIADTNPNYVRISGFKILSVSNVNSSGSYFDPSSDGIYPDVQIIVGSTGSGDSYESSVFHENNFVKPYTVTFNPDVYNFTLNNINASSKLYLYIKDIDYSSYYQLYSNDYYFDELESYYLNYDSIYFHNANVEGYLYLEWSY